MEPWQPQPPRLWATTPGSSRYAPHHAALQAGHLHAGTPGAVAQHTHRPIATSSEPQQLVLQLEFLLFCMNVYLRPALPQLVQPGATGSLLHTGGVCPLKLYARVALLCQVQCASLSKGKQRLQASRPRHTPWTVSRCFQLQMRTCVSFSVLLAALQYNFLNEKLPQYDDLPRRLMRSAVIGFSASAISDTCSNSVRVVKTSKQTATTPMTYPEVVRVSNSVPAAQMHRLPGHADMQHFVHRRLGKAVCVVSSGFIVIQSFLFVGHRSMLFTALRSNLAEMLKCNSKTSCQG